MNLFNHYSNFIEDVIDFDKLDTLGSVKHYNILMKTGSTDTGIKFK